VSGSDTYEGGRYLLLFKIALLSIAFTVQSFAVENPVLPQAFDVSLMRYNGAYYIVGTGTRGSMYRSENLRDWTSTPVIESYPRPPADSPLDLYNKIGAPDLVFINGVFHIVYNGIYRTHAPQITGIYPFKDEAYEPFRGIDPQLYVDEDGTVIYVKKRNPGDVNPLDGSYLPLGRRRAEVWIETLDSPWQHTGRWQQMLWGEARRWDGLDKTNFEGPELFKQHGRYYLLYVANAMDPRTGRYDTGVSSSTDLYAINNAAKSALPVLKRTTERIFHNYKFLLSPGEKTPWTGRYSFIAPSKDWTAAGFDDLSWKSGVGAFGYPAKVRDANIPGLRTEWKTNDIWIRREFSVPSAIAGGVGLYIRHEEGAEVYLNGTEIYRDTNYHRSYRLITLDQEKIKAALRTGRNVLSMHVHKNSPVVPSWDAWGGPAQYADVGLLQLGNVASDTVVTGPSQPNVFTGLNGFERWVSYKANFNGGKDGGQGIDRIYFSGPELFIDGPTTKDTPGYHPAPAKPSWSTNFTGMQNGPVPPIIKVVSGEWSLNAESLKQTSDAADLVCLLPTPRRRHFLLETWIQFASECEGSAGVFSVYVDKDNYHLITVNRSSTTWSNIRRIDGKEEISTFSLPAKYRFKDVRPETENFPETFHALKIIKDGAYADVFLDDVKLTVPNRVKSLVGVGSTGLYTDETRASFDSIIFTSGFEDFSSRMNGWKNSVSGTSTTGKWTNNTDALTAAAGISEAMIFKGDLLSNYEWNVTISAKNVFLTPDNSVGTYAAYVDQNNYTKVAIDYETRSLLISERTAGVERILVKKPLRIEEERGPDIQQGTGTQWVYPLRSLSEISSLCIRFFEARNDFQGVTFTAPPALNLEYRAGGVWNSLGKRAVSTGVDNRYSFEPILADALRVTVPVECEKTARPDDVWIAHRAKSAYYLRCIKRNGRLFVFLDNQQLADVPCSRRPSQVGLFANKVEATFDTMLCIEIMEDSN
jgi:hypothetical protein